MSERDTLFGGDAGDLGDDGLDILDRDQLLAPAFGHQHLGRADLVDHVDGLIGQLAVVDVFRREFHRAAQRRRGVAHPVMLFVIRLQAAQDFDRVFHARLRHVDLLEPAHQRSVLFEIRAVFLVGGRADAFQRAALQGGFQQVRCIHRAAAGRTRADDRVDFVDKQNGVFVLGQFADDCLQAFLEIAAIARAGEQRAHVEREDRRRQEHFRHVAVMDAFGEAFGDGGLADARIAHIKRVVLGAAAQHLDGALDLRLAADQRIDLALGGLLVEVHAIGIERFARALCFFLVAALLVGAPHGAVFRPARHLGDAVADVVDRVEARHVLFLQVVDRMALALGEHGDQHVGAGDFLAAGRLHVNGGALDDTLEARCRFRVFLVIDDKVRQVVVEIAFQVFGQLVDIDAAGLQDRDRVLVLGQRHQQMFQRRVFMFAFIGLGQCAVKTFFEIA